MSVHWPLQLVRPGGHAQAPPVHCLPPVQLTPQEPQLVESVCRLTQEPPQSVVGAVQLAVQPPR